MWLRSILILSKSYVMVSLCPRLKFFDLIKSVGRYMKYLISPVLFFISWSLLLISIII